jgi:iron complex transport system ATP-binding protein
MSPRPHHTLRLQDVVVTSRLTVPSLTLTPGLTVVVGDNGAGKSTLLDLCAGVTRPGAGVVWLDEVPLSTLPARTRAQRIASLGQRPQAAAGLLVHERIAQGLVPRQGHGVVDVDQNAVSARIAAVAAELGVAGLLGRRLTTLSGGQRQRVHVARALIDDDADAIVLDEPFAGLDDEASGLLAEALARRSDRIVLVSVHDLSMAAQLGGRLIGLKGGSVVLDGHLPAALDDVDRLGGSAVRVIHDGEWVGVLRRRSPPR